MYNAEEHVENDSYFSYCNRALGNMRIFDILKLKLFFHIMETFDLYRENAISLSSLCNTTMPDDDEFNGWYFIKCWHTLWLKLEIWNALHLDNQKIDETELDKNIAALNGLLLKICIRELWKIAYCTAGDMRFSEYADFLFEHNVLKCLLIESDAIEFTSLLSDWYSGDNNECCDCKNDIKGSMCLLLKQAYLRIDWNKDESGLNQKMEII